MSIILSNVYHSFPKITLNRYLLDKLSRMKLFDRGLLGDYLISVGVFFQPALILFQYVISSVLGMDIEQTTVYRVALTAAFMLPAMLVSLYRKPSTFFLSYFVVLSILGLTSIIFPDNYSIISEAGVRFLLPVVVPSFICLQAIKDISVVKISLRIVGWIAGLEALVFLLYFLMGRFSVEKYSLSFSYACLFPMLILYSQKQLIPVLISILIFFEVLAFGSRGAAVFFVAYIAFDFVRQKGKMRVIAIAASVLFVFLLPYFMSYLDDLGVYSRTLAMAVDGGMTESDGRNYIYNKSMDALWNNPILGVGVYGDRILLGGYCHNILLEILLDFGLFLGLPILLIFVYIGVNAIKISKGVIRETAYILLFSGVLPLLLSGSYLQEPNFAIFIGYCVWILNHRNLLKYYELNDIKQ